MQSNLPETIAPELVKTPEAAKMANVGERTWWRWSHDGTAPPPIKLGNGKQGAVRYRRSEIMQWISDGCPKIKGGAEA